MTTPSAINASRRVHSLADRLNAKCLDAELAALGQPSAGVAALAPKLTTAEQELALCRYVLGVLHRAGLLAAFKQLALWDALETGDAVLAELLGAQLVTEPSTSGPPTKRWAPPAGTPIVQHAEPVARELAGRLVARMTATAEGRARE